MRIQSLEVFVLGDGPEIDPDKGGVEPLACLCVHTSDGPVGYSEVFRVPPGVVQATVGGRGTHFGRLLIGQEVTHPERIWQHLWDAFMHTNRRGWEIIILGALDVAVWDIYGQMLGQPVWRLLGGVQRGPFQTHAETPRGARDSVLHDRLGRVGRRGDDRTANERRAEKLAALGYRAFKVEPMMSTPRDVIEMARRSGERLVPTPTLMVDVGYLFNDVPTAIRVCRELEELDIFFFETPFPVDAPEPYARLAEQTRIPLAMGEHGVTRWEFLDMMDRGRVSVVQPYMTTCGGLTEAKRIVELALAQGSDRLSRQLVDADSRRRDVASRRLFADLAVHRIRAGRGLRLAAAKRIAGGRFPSE